jgi:TolB-like protein/Flp pilus assembly protein TadD
MANSNVRHGGHASEYRPFPGGPRGVESGNQNLQQLRIDQEGAMGDAPPGKPSLGKPPEDRLDSWKAIAAYLKRDVTTVQRWEKREGMPVHRHLHDKGGSVYALTAEIDAWLRNRGARSEEEHKESPEETPVEAETGPARKWRPRADSWPVLAGMVALALVAVAYAMFRSRPGHAARPQIRALAVLPLTNLSGDPAQEYLADGMTEALIGRLSRIHNLRVISRTSVMRFRDPKLSVPQIASTLGVDAVVEGSVMREGNRIRVTAQLIRGATDDHLWSTTYDRDFQDVLSLESDLAESIAERVKVTITGEEQKRLTAARAVSPEVYEDYLKGWYNLNGNTYTQAGIEKSIGYFEEAVKRDPTFAPAYMGLADSYGELGTVFIGGSPQETRRKEMSAAQKALEIDPDLAEAHVVLGDLNLREWHWAEAEAEYKRALELNPNDADAYAGYADWLLCHGRTNEALDWANRGRELDPLSVYGAVIGWMLFQARRYDEAVHELYGVLAVRPYDAAALWYIGFVRVAQNRPGDAIPVLEKALVLSKRSPGVMGVLIAAYAHAGRRSDALRLLAELKRRKQAGYVPAAAFVNAYLGLGEYDQAFAALDEAYTERSDILQFLKVHPFFDPVRRDPRFAQLVHRVGLD